MNDVPKLADIKVVPSYSGAIIHYNIFWNNQNFYLSHNMPGWKRVDLQIINAETSRIEPFPYDDTLKAQILLAVINYCHNNIFDTDRGVASAFLEFALLKGERKPFSESDYYEAEAKEFEKRTLEMKSEENSKYDCPECDSSNVFRQKINHTFEYGLAVDRVDINVIIPIYHCNNCGFEFEDNEAHEIKHDAIIKHLREVGKHKQADYLELNSIK